MAQNVTIAGNQYPSVPSILIPKTGGGGNATFTDTSPTTASASDVAQGKIFFDSTGTQQTGTASGGASNVVTGTFTGTTTGAAMNITLNYSGSGYPIAVLIYPSEGTYNSSGSFYNLVQRYAYNTVLLVKNEINTVPTYVGGSANTNNRAFLVGLYKNSASSATSYSNTSAQSNTLYIDTDATSNSLNVLKVRSKTKLSVYIPTAGSNYGFAANIEYKYWVLYSS